MSPWLSRIAVSPWLSRTALPAAAVAAALLLAPSAAGADSTIPINSGNVPTSAAATAHECSPSQGGGPFTDRDVWVFVLPGNHSSAGDFVSVKLWFDTNGDKTADTTRQITADGGGFLNGGPAASKAFIATPAGWVLTKATAVVTGHAYSFTLSHTCVAGGKPTPTPTPTPAPSPTPTAPSSSPTPPASTPSAVPSTPAAPPAAPQLPTTGAAVGGIVLAGAVLVLAGGGMLLARRWRGARNGPTDEA